MKKITIIFLGFFPLFFCAQNRDGKYWSYENVFSYRLKKSLPLSYQFLYGGKNIYRHNVSFGYYLFDKQILELELMGEIRLNNNVNFLNINISYGYNILGTKTPSDIVYWEIIPIGGLSQNYLIKDETGIFKNKFFLGVNYGVRIEIISNSIMAFTFTFKFENVLNNQNEFGVFRNYLGGGIRFYL